MVERTNRGRSSAPVAAAPRQCREPQLATLRTKAPQQGGYLHKIKYDSYRVQLHHGLGDLCQIEPSSGACKKLRKAEGSFVEDQRFRGKALSPPRLFEPNLSSFSGGFHFSTIIMQHRAAIE
jgi:hypothetical protein